MTDFFVSEIGVVGLVLVGLLWSEIRGVGELGELGGIRQKAEDGL